MELHEYQMSRSFFDLRKRSLGFQTYFFLKTVMLFETKYYVKDFGSTGMNIYTNGLGHMITMAV